MHIPAIPNIIPIAVLGLSFSLSRRTLKTAERNITPPLKDGKKTTASIAEER